MTPELSFADLLHQSEIVSFEQDPTWNKFDMHELKRFSEKEANLDSCGSWFWRALRRRRPSRGSCTRRIPTDRQIYFHVWSLQYCVKVLTTIQPSMRRFVCSYSQTWTRALWKYKILFNCIFCNKKVWNNSTLIRYPEL